MSLAAFIRRQGRAWARRRQGTDHGDVTLTSRRIYILPTGQGVAFGIMIFLMLLGSMNYNNSVGLAVTFALTAFALVVMHHCHRALSGLRVTLADAMPIFAGQNAQFALNLHNDATFARLDIGVFVEQQLMQIISVPAGETYHVMLNLPAPRRGLLALNRISLRSRYPAGLFQAWAWLNTDLNCLVYPKPLPNPPAVPHQANVEGSARDAVQGDSDFAGLRDYRPGDPSRRIAWKAYARTDTLAVKTFSGADVAPVYLNWADAAGDTEARLSMLAAWCIDAHEAGRNFGLNLTTQRVSPSRGAAHLHQCLRALALHP